MLKKIIGLALLIFAVKYLLDMTQDAKEKEMQEEEDKNAAKKQALQQTITTLQGDLEVDKAVAALLSDYDGKLPVHAEKWEPIAKLPYDKWPVLKATLSQYNYRYADMYNKIEKPSSKFFKTGFYKKEFDPIRDKLKQRASW